MKTRIAIGLAGLLGLVTVLKTASYYAGVDGFALSITLVMAAALICGLIELYWVGNQTERMQAELDRLPKEVDDAHLGKLSPLLRALIQARMDRSPMAVPGPVFAPYLIGLLVMLGLLGTFLGLFETLRGASLALTTSTDVDALRAGLRTPMQGLMRSFGTSAAGVASSAMLGLGAVFTRRAATTLGLRLHELASGPLAKYSPAHRQLLALEALSSQGEAWPTAARSLEGAAAQLDSLRDSWAKAHDRAAEQLQQTVKGASELLQTRVGAASDALETSVKNAIAAVQSAVEESAANAGKRAVDQLSPLVKEAVSGTVKAATAHLDQVLAAVERDTKARVKAQGEATDALEKRVRALLEALQGLERERRNADEAQVERFEARTAALMAQRSDADAALLERLGEQLGAYGKARGEAEHQTLARLDAHAQQVIEALSQQHTALTAGQTDQLARLDRYLTQTREQLAAQQVAQSDEQQRALAALIAGLDQLASQEKLRADALSQHFEASLSQLQTALSEASERDRARAETLSDVAGKMHADLTEAALVVRERLEQSAEAEAAQQARTEALFERLKAASQAIAGAAESQVQHLQTFVEASDGRMREAEGKSQERLSAFLEGLHAHAEAQAKRLSDHESALLARNQKLATELSEFERAQAIRLSNHGEEQQGRLQENLSTLADLLSEHLRKLDERMSQSTGLLENAAGMVQAGGAELVAVAEMFTAAVDKQREAAQAWLESLGEIERSVSDAGEAAAADVLGQHLARTHEVFDRQLRFQQELMEQLRKHNRDSIVAPKVAVDASL